VQLQQNYTAFQSAGAEVVALAVAPRSAVNGVRQTVGATYPMLADPEHKAAEAYGVYNLLRDQLAAPSVFVIDTDQSILWYHVGRDPGDRPGVQEIMQNLP